MGQTLLIHTCCVDPVTHQIITVSYAQWSISREAYCLYLTPLLILGSFKSLLIYSTQSFSEKLMLSILLYFFFFIPLWSFSHLFLRLCYIYLKATHFFSSIIRKIFHYNISSLLIRHVPELLQQFLYVMFTGNYKLHFIVRFLFKRMTFISIIRL